MKKIHYVLSVLIIASISACSNGQGVKTSLEAKDFQNKISETKDAVVLDVRTADEFSGGHIANAQNIDWNSSDAENTLKKLDASKTYFVYCLSGGRSSSAANFMRDNGFKNVYELNGGMMKWRASQLPEETNTTATTASSEMTVEAYEALLKNEKTVIIDIYAEWCAPCKRMAPYLTEMQKTMGDKVEIIRIDADKNPNLCKYLKVDALPTLFVYKANAKTFEHVGYLSQEDLLKQL